jgi:hypothetical protein
MKYLKINNLFIIDIINKDNKNQPILIHYHKNNLASVTFTLKYVV